MYYFEHIDLIDVEKFEKKTKNFRSSGTLRSPIILTPDEISVQRELILQEPERYKWFSIEFMLKEKRKFENIILTVHEMAKFKPISR